MVDSRIDVLEKNSSMSIDASSKSYLEIANVTPDTVDTMNRGAILVSIPFQTGTYSPSLYLVQVTNGVFRNPIALTPTENANVISTTLSTGDDGKKIYFEVRGSSWCPPVIVPLFNNTNEVKFTMRYIDAIPS